MAYRLAIIAAGVADSADAAAELVAEMRTAPRGRPPEAIADVLGALEGSSVGPYSVGRRTDSRGVLLTVPHPEAGVLEALLLLTKDRYLAVYDIKLHRLYDPTARVEVDVLLPGVRLPYLTRDLLWDLVSHPQLPEPKVPYLTVERAAGDYIQAWCRPDGGYRLEYHEGGPESHLQAQSGDAAAVVDVILARATGDPSWRSAVDWEFLDLDATGSTGGGDGPVDRDDTVTTARRYLSLQNEHLADGSWLNLDAQLDSDGGLRVIGQDLGPVTRMMSDDGEYEWAYSVAAGDVPALLLALGGTSGEAIMDVLEQRWSGENCGGLGEAIRRSGVPYRFWSYP